MYQRDLETIAKLELALKTVRGATTAGEADSAASKPVGHFIYDKSLQRTATRERLLLLWNGGAIRELRAGPQFNEFKSLLILWLEQILAFRRNN